MSRLLALDWGSKRIGLARCDSSVGIPLPLGYVENTGTVYFDLSAFVMRYQIDTILYGYPQGNEDVIKKIDNFIKNLKISVNADIEFLPIDEHYTSLQAANRTGDFGQKHISQDTISAMIILERWLEKL